jgi:hypothetical protein
MDAIEFSQLLQKCVLLDNQRHPGRKQIIHDFTMRAINDSKFLLNKRVPPDILEQLRKEADQKCQ